MNRAADHQPPQRSHLFTPVFPHLHTGNADAHSPDDAQVLLDKGLQLTDTATLAGERAVVDLPGSHIQPFGPGYPKM